MSHLALLLFFKIVLAILGPFLFHVNFRMSLSNVAKKSTGILIGIALDMVYQFVKYCHLTKIRFSNPCALNIFPFIWVFFNSSQQCFMVSQSICFVPLLLILLLIILFSLMLQ